MGTTRLCSVVLLAVVVVLGQSLSVDEIARRQSQLTMDTFRFFEQQLQDQQYQLERRLGYLEARVSDLESRPVVGERLEGDRGEGARGGGGEGGGRGGGEGGRGGGGGGGGGRGGGNNEPVDPREQEPTPEPQEPEPEPQKPVKLVTTLKPTTVKPTTPGLEYDRTCAEIYNHGYIYNGEYTIDPDGAGPVSAFTVFCNMDGGEGITEVGHDSEMENIPVNGFEDPGSFVLEPTYANGVASMLQLGALADASVICTQRVRYACKSSGLMEIDPKSGETFAWWVDRYGRKRVNFGGAPTDSGKCGCAFGGPNKDENTCFMGSETCSCDHKKAKNQFDEGEFDDKDLLPVLSINLGDTGHKKERGAITLGKFICKG